MLQLDETLQSSRACASEGGVESTCTEAVGGRPRGCRSRPRHLPTPAHACIARSMPRVRGTCQSSGAQVQQSRVPAHSRPQRRGPKHAPSSRCTPEGLTHNTSPPHLEQLLLLQLFLLLLLLSLRTDIKGQGRGQRSGFHPVRGRDSLPQAEVGEARGWEPSYPSCWQAGLSPVLAGYPPQHRTGGAINVP